MEDQGMACMGIDSSWLNWGAPAAWGAVGRPSSQAWWPMETNPDKCTD